METTEMVQTDPDAWLSTMLGCDAFRLTIPSDCSSESLRNSLVGISPGFYFAKVATDAVQHLRELQDSGFHVVDMNVTLERQPMSGVPQQEPTCAIGTYTAGRHGNVAEIGESSFIYSRFHLDPEIPNDIANRIKREWVENCMSGARGDQLWIAERNGETAGFLAELHIEQADASVTVIDLIGVARQHQGHGVGRQLVEHTLRRATGDCVRVGTQAANIPSLRLYETTGFRVISTQYVLHGRFG